MNNAPTAALLLLLTAHALPAQFFVPDQDLNRKVTRATWFGLSGEQSLAIDYGAMPWRTDYQAFLEGKEARHVRLGSGPWATLHTSVDLTLGNTRIPRGRWYLGAHRDEKQNWTLTLMAGDKLDLAGLGGGATIRVKPELEAAMRLERGDQHHEALDVRLVSSKDGKPNLALTISFGRYRLRGDVTAAFDTKKPAGAPEFAMSAPDKVTTTASGLQYEVLRAGVGDFPKPTDTVRLHYCCWLTDGTQIDSSYLHEQPAVFPVSAVVKGFAEGVQAMQPGAVFRLTIPGPLAYGQAGAPPAVPPNATMVFTVSLLGIEK
jgi:hypothetical protein